MSPTVYKAKYQWFISEIFINIINLNVYEALNSYKGGLVVYELTKENATHHPEYLTIHLPNL